MFWIQDEQKAAKEMKGAGFWTGFFWIESLF